MAITPLSDALPQAVGELVGDVLRLGMRASRDELGDEVRAALDQAEADSGLSVADTLIASVRSGGLGVLGLDETRRMLELGAVDVLVLASLSATPADQSEQDDARPLSDRTDDMEPREELVRLAALTSADVEVVSDHQALERAGGIGALLRYRPD